MKKLINDPRRVVREMLEGQADLHPSLALLDEFDVIVRTGLPEPVRRSVAVISGGGSGHEPAHAGYVGDGLLTGAVAGDVFTSPSVDAVLAAIRAAAGPAGALLIVKNYTGDRLNFGLAAELAVQQGIPTEIVVVADDVALKGVVEADRRRGIAGTVFIHKVAGAAAERGLALAEVARLARQAAKRLGTMRVALGACTLPTVRRSGFTLDEKEIEIGLGIHGEMGVKRTAMMPADALVDIVLDQVTDDLAISDGSRVALLVNGLGGTPPMELAIVARRALSHLRGKGIEVVWAQAANFLTALEMPGFSLSVFELDDQQLDLLEQSAKAPAWLGSGLIGAKRNRVSARPVPADESAPALTRGPLGDHVKAAALAVARAFELSESYLTDLDAKAGDGDLGASMVRGAQAIRALPETAWATPATALSAIGNAFRHAIAGSSGPFYATALLRAARQLGVSPAPNIVNWDEALVAGMNSVSEVGGAKPGDRTMVDAITPALDAWHEALQSGAPPRDAWKAAIAAARKATDGTAEMMPKLGRAIPRCSRAGISGCRGGSGRRLDDGAGALCSLAGSARLVQVVRGRQRRRPTLHRCSFRH